MSSLKSLRICPESNVTEHTIKIPTNVTYEKQIRPPYALLYAGPYMQDNIYQRGNNYDDMQYDYVDMQLISSHMRHK